LADRRDEARLHHARDSRAYLFRPRQLGRRRDATLIHPVTHRFRSVSAVFFASRVDNSRLTTQVRPTLDRRPDRSAA